MKLNEEHKNCEIKTEEPLYRIGAFAQMNHITVKTLRFYEEEGLLIPAFINDENGYRFYTMSQMADVHKISALKLSGFTLDEIKKLDNGEDENSILMKKRSDILRKMSELTRQLSVIDGYIGDSTQRMDAPVLVKTLEEVDVACLRARIESYDELFDLMPALGGLMEEAGCECAMPEYCFTSYLDNGYKDSDIEVEVCQSVVKTFADRDGLYFKTLPKVEAATIFHKGSYDSFSVSYEAVLKFIEDNGYDICGPIREKYIDGIWNKLDESEWLSEIQVPVRKKELL